MTNFSRKKKEIQDKEELLEWILCKPELKDITQILAAKIHPEIFITEDTFMLISHYMRFKRYGMNYLYSKGIGDTPNKVLQAFDTISNLLDKDEADRVKAMKEKNKNSK